MPNAHITHHLSPTMAIAFHRPTYTTLISPSVGWLHEHKQLACSNENFFSRVVIQTILAVMAKKTTLQEFEAAFPRLVDDMTAHAKQYGVPTNVLDWFRQVSC